MVDVFGHGLKRGPTGPQGEKGPPGKKGDKGDPGKNGLNELFNWFPQMLMEQIHKHNNLVTFLVENVSGKDGDVEVDEHNKVVKWKSLKQLKNKETFFIPVSGSGACLKNIPFQPDHQRYGLKFNYNDQNMYSLSNHWATVLSYTGTNTILTITFSVGELVYDETRTRNKLEKDAFLIHDHNTQIPSPFRGISVTNNGKESFDLCLHGAFSEQKDKLKIAEKLKVSCFYTLQVKWGAQIEDPDGTMRILTSFYRIYKDKKRIVDNIFHQRIDDSPKVNALYIGGFNNDKNSTTKTSNFFTGVLSNIEVLLTAEKVIPKELLHFIATKQCIINDDWLKTK